jgi:predicted DCC family thiol-disulfide oxidoreductase YuxK|tara:strand:- start:1437 stop:1547 length:111 start_codon:yes stop_codon:yes gene_type:complete
MRDSLYRLVANNRYKWFGKTEQCRVPTDDLKERFMD